MSDSLHVRRPRDRVRFPDADHELTDEEMEVLYGAFIEAGLGAFRTDATYALAMYEGAERLERRHAATRRGAATRRARGH